MRTRFLVLVFAVGLLATACGSSAEAGDGIASLETSDTVAVDVAGSDEPVAAVDAEQAMLDFAACMRDQGVEIEDPTVDADGNVQFGGLRGAGGEDGEFDREAMRAASEACSEQLEGVALGFGGRGEFDQTELQDTMVEYAACMRDNGYDMADPDLSNFGPGAEGEPGEGGGGGPFGQIDRDDPDYVAAHDVCGDILGGLPGGGLGRPGGGNG